MMYDPRMGMAQQSNLRSPMTGAGMNQPRSPVAQGPMPTRPGLRAMGGQLRKRMRGRGSRFQPGARAL
jgi:hypothetical protein